MQDYFLRDHRLHVAVGTAPEEWTILGDVLINSSSFLGRLQTKKNKNRDVFVKNYIILKVRL